MQSTTQKPVITKNDEDEYLPIIVHYYPGIISRTNPNPFGHIAIQFGRYYLSYTTRSSDAEKIDSPDILLLKNDEAIENEMFIYGSEHIRIPLKLLETDIDLKNVINQWQKEWLPSQYDALKKNCAHSVIYCTMMSTTITIPLHYDMSEKVGLRPHEVAERLCDMNLKKCGDEYESLLKDEKINPLLKIEKLITNNINQLFIQIAKEKASHIPTNIEVYQNKILSLLQLRKNIPFKNLSEMTLDLAQEQKNNPSQQTKECAIILASIKNYPSILKEYNNQRPVISQDRERYLLTSYAFIIAVNEARIAHSDKLILKNIIYHFFKQDQDQKETNMTSNEILDLHKFIQRYIKIKNMISAYVQNKPGPFIMKKIDSYLEHMQVFITQIDKNKIPARKAIHLAINNESDSINYLSNSLEQYLTPQKNSQQTATSISTQPATTTALPHRDLKTDSITSNKKTVTHLFQDRIAISSWHIEWLKYEIQNLIFKYDSEKNKDAVIFMKDLLIELNQREQEYFTKSPLQVFSEFVDQHLVLTWNIFQKKLSPDHPSATPSKLITEKAVHLLNSTPREHKLERDIGILLNKIALLKREPDIAPGLLAEYPVNMPREITNKTAKNIFEMLKSIIMSRLPIKDNPLSAHLQNCIISLEKMINNNIYTHYHALEDLITQINIVKCDKRSASMLTELNKCLAYLHTPEKSTQHRSLTFSTQATRYQLSKDKSATPPASPKKTKP
jgi:hypothetical protein